MNPSTTRRGLIGGSMATIGATTIASMVPAQAAPASTLAPAEVGDTGTFLVTLGTAAGPAVRSPRNGIATALVVDGHLYVVDCGLGVVRQIANAGLPVDRLAGLFLTHLHSDHIGELPGFLLYQWGPQVSGFEQPFAVVGPGRAGRLPKGTEVHVIPPTPGTEDLVEKVLDGYGYDINIRITDEDRPPLNDLVRARDIKLPRTVKASANGALAPAMEPFEVYADERVRVLATLVDHPPVFPSYGFRFETPHGVVALSGDTAEHRNTVALARDADILVHEAVYLDFYRNQGLPQDFLDHLAESHTEPAGVGRVAAQAGVAHLVLSHLAGVATDEQWATPIRAEYDGQITVAADGQVFQLDR